MNALSRGGGRFQNLFLCCCPGFKAAIHPHIPASKDFDHFATLLILSGNEVDRVPYRLHELMEPCL
jgi:hypothetical protein